jgi:hypothetical protein
MVWSVGTRKEEQEIVCFNLFDEIRILQDEGSTGNTS